MAMLTYLYSVVKQFWPDLARKVKPVRLRELLYPVMGKTPQRDCVCKFYTLYARNLRMRMYYTLSMNEQKLQCTYF